MTERRQVIGVDVNKISPVWLITLLLIFTLGYTTYRTLRKVIVTVESTSLNGRKGLELRAIETGGEQEVQRALPVPPDEEHAVCEGLRCCWLTCRQIEEEESSEADALMPTTAPAHHDVGVQNKLLHADGKQVELEELDPQSETSSSSDRKTLVAILQEERKIPVSQVFKMALISIIVLVISVMKGGGRGSCAASPPSYPRDLTAALVTCGSLEYWLIKVGAPSSSPRSVL
eukprot:371085-Hanusia_phi.AAC.2